MSATITWTSAAALRRVIVCSVCSSTPDDRHRLRTLASAVRDELSTYKERTVREGGIYFVEIDEGRRDLLMVGGIKE